MYGNLPVRFLKNSEIDWGTLCKKCKSSEKFHFCSNFFLHNSHTKVKLLFEHFFKTHFLNNFFSNFQVCCSVFAGVYNEYIIKNIAGQDVDIMLQNVYMYLVILRIFYSIRYF